MKKRPVEPKRENRRLAELVPHPDQAKYYRHYGEYAYAALKDDIAKNGLKHLIEVLPPGNAADLPADTILTGHTRQQILCELGHTTAEVSVRYDLRAATRADVDMLFLNDNEARRQQDRLGQARAAIRRFQIEREQKGRGVIGDPLQYRELRDRIGQIVGMSGRNLQRYLNVLSAPVEVQDAFQAKRVALVTAAKVVGLSKDDQEELTARLQADEDATDVFAAFFPSREGKHVKTADAVAAFARSLKRAGDDLASRVEKVKAGPLRRNEEALRAGRELIEALLDKVG